MPQVFKSFFGKRRRVQYVDENTLKSYCNHCQQVLQDSPRYPGGPMPALPDRTLTSFMIHKDLILPSPIFDGPYARKNNGLISIFASRVELTRWRHGPSSSSFMGLGHREMTWSLTPMLQTLPRRSLPLPGCPSEPELWRRGDRAWWMLDMERLMSQTQGQGEHSPGNSPCGWNQLVHGSCCSQ